MSRSRSVRSVLSAVFLALLAGGTGGCATYQSLASATPASPKVFSGTRLDLHAIGDDQDGLRRFNTAPPTYPWLDLPASLTADLFLLPLTLGVVSYEAIAR